MKTRDHLINFSRSAFGRRLAFVCALMVASVWHQAICDGDAVAHGPRMVLIIRHAEKPEVVAGAEKDPNLSKRGFERAEALARVIPDRFAKPDFLIATKKSAGSDRPAETITPLSKVLHESIDATERDAEFDKVAHALLSDPKYDGKVVLIAWHHGKIPQLAKALGVSDVPEHWDSAVFDRVWQITYENGKPSWKDLPEKALPGDSQK